MVRGHLTAMRPGFPVTLAVLGMATGLPLQTVREALDELTARGHLAVEDLGFA